MRKLYRFAVSVLLLFASFTKSAAQTSIAECPSDIDFSVQGNYVLFCSTNTSAQNVDVAQNEDSPFGYYYHNLSNGQYSKFANWGTGNKSGKQAWYRNSNEYLFLLPTGNVHPLVGIAPAYVFTAPADGWYYVGMTFNRINTNINNTLTIRNRFVHVSGSNLTANSAEQLCSEDYGNDAVAANRSQSHTMDFFVKLKAGDKISTEEDANSRNSSGETVFSRYVIATYTSASTPISDEYVANSSLPSYDPHAQITFEPTMSRGSIKLAGTDKYLVRKNKASGRNFYYSAFFTLEEIQADVNNKKAQLEDFVWEYDLVKNANGGYNLKDGDNYMSLDAYISEGANADDNRFVFYKQNADDTEFAICRANDGKYWTNNIYWKNPYNLITTSTDPLYLFELCEAPAETPYAYYNFSLDEKGENNLKALANRNGATVNVTLERTLSSKYWNTFCVPFEITADKISELFGNGTQLTEFTSVEGSTMNLSEAQSIEAGKPYLIKPANDVVNPSFENVAITAAQPKSVAIDGFSFTGVYAPTAINTDGTDLFITTSGALNRPAVEKNTIRGMRAYITIPSGTQAKLAIMGETTAINDVNIVDKADNSIIYTINGSRLNNANKGIVIKNGKKFVVK